MKKQYRGVIVSPKGQEHELDTIEDAVRTLVILSDELTKENYDEILKVMLNDPRQAYSWNGWTVKVDLTSKRKGIGVVVTDTTNPLKVVEYDSIKECALNLNMKQQKVRSLINSFNNVHDGKRFTKKAVW